ncbi:cobalt ECF transporter T component CbiQ [Pararhodobacter sp. CCB-MM2]|uniref:cobalt ECF transporter T component CbiQ n=1 Tax=Pararhodobacter sp. CCB-MM2 TaxID=1786003 RepID=UPI0013141518|nr:cobalt ECF transporter T component CbiQ [Pararhodobacter sp. CCB-MM2]
MTLMDRTANTNRWRNRSLAEKLLIGLGFLLMSVTLPPWPAAPMILICVLAFTFAGAGVRPRLWFRIAVLPLGFLAAGSLTLLVQISTDGLTFAPDGVERVTELSLRSFTAMSCLLFLALTTPAIDLVQGTRRLRLPEELLDIALLTYRFIFLVGDEAIAMTRAQRARLGYSTRRRWLRSSGQVIANLLPRALARAHRMERGLAARGWQAGLATLSRPRPKSWRLILLTLFLQVLIMTRSALT